ncbi:hypothetical protein [Mesorhizobium sp.]|uniref:hypothetical protein n=1 Tax=Mesorhizobium sp. TaxID=1871066 RepID=UPI0025BCE9C1|nr:hypothetical protein [Mesorhizobium sp.]
MEFISGSRKPVNTIHAIDYEFYEELHTVIEREPSSMLDPEMLGLFASIGIQKGKPFAPDERMKKLLVEALAIGNAIARALAFRPRLDGAQLYPNSSWNAASWTAAMNGSGTAARAAAISTPGPCSSTRRR